MMESSVKILMHTSLRMKIDHEGKDVDQTTYR